MKKFYTMENFLKSGYYNIPRVIVDSERSSCEKTALRARILRYFYEKVYFAKGEVMFNGRRYLCFRGEFIASQRELAEYFKSASQPAKNPDYNQLIALIEKDLEEGFTNANAIASDSNDRGALRALVWSEKVTRILKSLLTRYQNEGDAMLENTGVYVCTICGFVYIGETPPEVCPVCKVPNWKFEKVERR